MIYISSLVNGNYWLWYWYRPKYRPKPIPKIFLAVKKGKG